MDITLAVTNITKGNRRLKLVKAIRALSRQMGLNARLPLEKAKTRKYLSKKWVNGQWVYEYPKSNNERRVYVANQAELIPLGIKPLTVNASNVIAVANRFFAEFQQRVNSGLRCKALQKIKVAGIDDKHFFIKQGKARKAKELVRRAALLPFIIPIIEKYGSVSHAQKNSSGTYDYELVARADINGKRHAITLILSQKPNGLLYLSVFDIQNKWVKSLVMADSQHREVHKSPIPRPTASRHSIWFGKSTSPNDYLAKSDKADGPYYQMTLLEPAPLIIPEIRAVSIERVA